MSKKRKWLYATLLFVIVIALAAVYLYGEYNRKHKDTSSLEPDYTMTTSAIINEFEADQQSAAKKYNDKIVMTKGIVKDILKDDRGFYSLMLGDTASMSSVKCSMDSVHNNEAATLQKGTYASIKGVCAGFNSDDLLGSDVIMVRCVIEKTKN